MGAIGAVSVEGLAGKGGICLSGATFDRVNGKLPLGAIPSIAN